MTDDRYADCDACGERYHGGDIERYMTEVHRPAEDEWIWLCKSHLQDDRISWET